jgi:uncharacterized protein HemX
MTYITASAHGGFIIAAYAVAAALLIGFGLYSYVAQRRAVTAADDARAKRREQKS